MAAKIVAPATGLPVLLADAKLSLSEDGTEKDTLITAWIGGVTEFAEHYTGRSFINRSMRSIFDEFLTDGPMELAAPPLASVSTVRYYDENGVLQTLDPQDYVVDLESEPGNVSIADGLIWPITQIRSGAVLIDYTTGYGSTDASIPGGIKLYILAKLAEQFDPMNWVKRDTVQSSYIDRLLDPYKVYA